MASTNYFTKEEAKARYGRQPGNGLNFRFYKKDSSSIYKMEIKKRTINQFHGLRIVGQSGFETIVIGNVST